jgi:hypothetical protein
MEKKTKEQLQSIIEQLRSMEKKQNEGSTKLCRSLEEIVDGITGDKGKEPEPRKEEDKKDHPYIQEMEAFRDKMCKKIKEMWDSGDKCSLFIMASHLDGTEITQVSGSFRNHGMLIQSFANLMKSEKSVMDVVAKAMVRINIEAMANAITKDDDNEGDDNEDE